MKREIIKRTVFLLGCILAFAGDCYAQTDMPRTPRNTGPDTLGAGPTSSAPGMMNYGPPKGASETTDARGVTTKSPVDTKAPAHEPSDTKPPLDQGNENFDPSGRM